MSSVSKSGIRFVHNLPVIIASCILVLAGAIKSDVAAFPAITQTIVAINADRGKTVVNRMILCIIKCTKTVIAKSGEN